ncbi:MAG TPA: hypothetical protein VH764_07290 [Gemmatimonadales bacterium]|jgi:hypothetical protein
MGDPTHPDEARRLEQLLGALARSGPPGERRPDCPDDEALAALAAGEIAVAERKHLVAHVATCGHCRAAVASLARAFADPAVAEARAGAVPAARRRLYRVAVPAAAAAVVFVALFARSGGDIPPDSLHRASDVPAAQAPVPLSPRGPVERPDLLRWAGVGGAGRYRVTLYRSDGQVLYGLELPDTATPLPDSVPLTTGQVYLWKVEARTGWDRWTASELVRFTVAEERAP